MTAPACPTCAALRERLHVAETRAHELANQVMALTESTRLLREEVDLYLRLLDRTGALR